MRFIVVVRRLLVLSAVGAFLVGSSGDADAITYRTVALSGQPAPGVSPLFKFASFATPVINIAGQTAFYANVGLDPTSATTRGIWSEGNGSLQLVARTGSVVIETGNEVAFKSFLSPLAFSDHGDTAFTAELLHETRNPHGIWSGKGGNLRLVVQEGLRAPGTNTKFYSHDFPRYSVPGINGLGQVAFFAGVQIRDGQLDGGIWSEGGESLKLVALQGAPAPGTDVGTNFTNLDMYAFSPAFNDAGQTAFHAAFASAGVGNTNNIGIWSEGGGNLHMVAHGGSAAPGTESGVTFAILSLFPAINDAGQTAFFAGLSGADVDSTNDSGIWSEGGGSLHLVARTGSSAAGTGDGVNFLSFGGRSSYYQQEIPLSDFGDTAFLARLTGVGVDPTNDSGIWSEGGGSLHLVAREGSHAPGTDIGVNFSDLAPVGLTLNAVGRIAFLAGLRGADVTTANGLGIWAEGTSGLELVARTGDQLLVAQGELKTIAELQIADGNINSRARPDALNDRSQLAFWASALSQPRIGIG